VLFCCVVTYNDYVRDDLITYLPEEIQSFEVVIARYNEDLSWVVKEFPDNDATITIYNKGKDDLNLPKKFNIIKLPNIGRESHTYLYHIIKNYNNLADRTLFLQGDPYTKQYLPYVFLPLKSYKKIAKTRCRNIIANHCFTHFAIINEYHFNRLPPERRSITVYRDYNFFDFRKNYIQKRNPYGIIYMVYAANFAVDKDKILRNEISYYQKIIATLDSLSPIEGYYLERLWDEIFDSTKK